jgi:hypothetical protein
VQPVIIEDTQSIAANTISQNIIVLNAGLRGLLNAPWPARMRFLATISAAGLLVDVLHGASSIIASSAPRVATFPEDPLDLMNEDGFTQAQEQMVVRVNNPTGGALSITYRLMLIPLVDETWDGNPVQLPPDCRVMQNLQVITTLQSDVQLLDGLPFEQNDMPSILRVLMTGSAAGLVRQLFIDQDRIAPPSAVSIANRIPQDPFDSTIAGVEVAGNKRQFLSVSNPTGGSLTVRWKTKNQMLIRT